MKDVSVQELAANPSGALRALRDGPITVLGPGGPEAVLVHLQDPLLAERGVKLGLATALYRDRCLSLGLAARLAGLETVASIQHVSRRGIPVVTDSSATVAEDVDAIAGWEQSGGDA